MSSRSTRGVIESHLHYRQVGDLERDLVENYAPDVRLLSAEGVVEDGLIRAQTIHYSTRAR
ncbi:hypothetical protein [Nocardioides pyridinolyticus]